MYLLNPLCQRGCAVPGRAGDTDALSRHFRELLREDILRVHQPHHVLRVPIILHDDV